MCTANSLCRVKRKLVKLKVASSIVGYMSETCCFISPWLLKLSEASATVVYMDADNGPVDVDMVMLVMRSALPLS